MFTHSNHTDKSAYRNKNFLLAAFAGALTTLLITILVYSSFFQNILENYRELSGDVVKLIIRKHPDFLAILLANLAHGFLLATIFRWGDIRSARKGARAGVVVACLTEIYFTFTQYAMFKTMTIASAILDTCMWMLINAVVGALVAWILGKGAAKAAHSAPG